MLGIIKHRGPDHDGYCIYENLALGMTRLSIVDIEGGAQPMHSQNGTLSIVFNGEIYNHRELAKEFLSERRVLHSHSDTEVILALYQKLGMACLEKLRGMFAFAILDRNEKSIVIARDRIGIKPVYFWYEGSTLVFGSEVKSLLASKIFNAEANLNSVADYLSLRYVPGPCSLFKDVRKLAPGHWMKWKDGKLIYQQYWQPTLREKQLLTSTQFQEQFDHLFQESVDIHRMGEVPYGAYLSGGLDSAAIVNALTKHASTQPIKTFTVGFGWQGDELYQARETANLLGTDHHEIICGSSDFEHLPKIIWHADEPLGDPIVLPTYRLATEASKEVKVVLTGEGADEILGGYLFHKLCFLAGHYRRFVPKLFHSLMVKPLLYATPVALLNKGFQYPGYLGNSGKQRLLTFLDLAQRNNIERTFLSCITLFEKDVQNRLFNDITMQESSVLQMSASGNTLDNILRLQYEHWLPDNILMRQDKLSMACGLELRVPFLDHKLVEFMETVPDHLKLTLYQNKILLRNHAKNHGIDVVAKRKKNAFYFPMENYFETPSFQQLLSSTLGPEPVSKRGLFRYEMIAQLIDNMHKKDFLASKQVFALISLELWFQMFIDKQVSF